MTVLTRIPVRVAGAFEPVAYVGHVNWAGTAAADEPITALALSRTPDATDWARVGRLHTNELSISLRVRPDEADESRRAVWVWLSMQPAGQPQGHGQAMLQQKYRLASTAPFMFTHSQVVTGEVAWFARPWTAEDNRLGALFVAERDARSARNHLWHLRAGIDGPDAAVTTALNRGRHGTLGPSP